MMTKNICFFLLVLLSTVGAVSAQVAEQYSVAPVPVGGQLPKAFWDFKHALLDRGNPKEYVLSSDRGKLIILDFWATWCGSCIKRFPKLEEIEKAFPGKVKVLLVNSVGTGDTEESLISRFKSGSGTFTSTGLSVVVGDTVFLRTFPHKALPHYVWIADGDVRAVTTAELLTVENVGLLLEHMDVLNVRKKNIEAFKAKNN
ncbi:TlpA family protein disulfide reductase [Pedobacter sp. N23S346]|uniref:TlpA family protein disulfide reductase n=1 Tax=Pedobacter sp. N23S346 TaxID=3402750 RepID=UPI003ABEE467